MKTATNYFMGCLALLLLCSVTADAQFSGKVCFVTPSTATTFPASSYTNADDAMVINKLVSWGFTVDVAIGGNATAAGSFNNTAAPAPADSVLAKDYKMVMYSEFMSSGNGFRVRGLPAAGPYTPISVPVVSLDNWFVRYSSAGFINTSTSSATTFINTTTNSVDFVANAPEKFMTGFTAEAKGVVLASATTESAGNYLNYCVIPPTTGQTIVPVATVSGTTDQLVAWGAEAGTVLYNNAGVVQPTVVLKKRYAAVGVMGPAYAGLTTDGWNLIKNAITWALESTTSVEQSENRPTGYTLEQNYPNPFNPSTEIAFTLATGGTTNLSVFNVLGQKVATVVNQSLSAGAHHYTIDASSMTSGVYFYRLESGRFSSMKKMMLVK
ncbi:MAG: T9SS C-terminal target domain-containing protein [Ignavibacteriae bacterium]|nr:MAG: T9SS C-terminal target domain-containing protein [Ignavibacteriota bacterium]